MNDPIMRELAKYERDLDRRMEAQDIIDEEMNDHMVSMIQDDIGLSEALTGGFTDMSELRQALADAIEMRGCDRDAVDLCHKILGRIIAEAAINHLMPGE